MPANLYTNESSVNGTTTITFPWPIFKLTILNDSANELQWRFKTGHSWATLKAYETVAMDVHTTQLILNSTAAVDYRVWGIG